MAEQHRIQEARGPGPPPPRTPVKLVKKDGCRAASLASRRASPSDKFLDPLLHMHIRIPFRPFIY